MLLIEMVRNHYDVRSCWFNPILFGRSSLLETGTTHPLIVSNTPNHLLLNRSKELWYLIMPINQKSWSSRSISTLWAYKCGLPYTKSSCRSMDPKLYSIRIGYWSYPMVCSQLLDSFWIQPLLSCRKVIWTSRILRSQYRLRFPNAYRTPPWIPN